MYSSEKKEGFLGIEAILAGPVGSNALVLDLHHGLGDINGVGDQGAAQTGKAFLQSSQCCCCGQGLSVDVQYIHSVKRMQELLAPLQPHTPLEQICLDERCQTLVSP